MRISISELEALVKVVAAYGDRHAKAVKTKSPEERTKLLHAEVELLETALKFHKKHVKKGK